MYSSLKYSSSSDAMYPPPGSFKYTTPKPTRNGSAPKHISDDEINCDFINACVSYCASTPFFRLRFWKIMILFVVVVTTGHFSTVVIFRKITEPLFLVKYDSSASRLPSGMSRKVTEDPNSHDRTQHRKMNNLLSLSKTPSSEVGAALNNGVSNLPSRPKERFLRIRNANLTSSNNKSSGSKVIPSILSHVDSKVRKSDFLLNLSRGGKKPKLGSREKVSNSSLPLPNLDPNLKLCPPIPPNLEGPVKVNLNNIPSLEVQEQSHEELEPGGRFRPSECLSRHKVAIIIPFRDRATHLAVFLHNLLPFLERQQVDFAIFIVEQAGKNKFNRAMLMNVGSLEALKLYPYNCFIFHDIDLIPEDDRNLYTCPEQPRHMSVAINNMKYKLPYNDIFGGVSAMTVKQFQTVNGFSNKFWGWGGEDDDMSNRIKFHGYFISRYPANVARYTMMPHKKDHPNPQRYKYLNEGKKRYSTDGLNSVTYKMLDIQLRKLYTWFYVELLKT